MLLDERLEFADDLTAWLAQGTLLLGDVIDLGVARDIGHGQPLYLVIQVTELYASGGSALVNFRLRSDGVAAIHATSSSAHLETGPMAFALLTLGAQFVIPLPSEGVAYERYLGVQVVVTGADLTAGDVNAFLTTEPTVKPTTSYADAAS